MAEMLLINPRPRARKSGSKRRSAAQRAATRRLVAMNRARSGGSRRRARRRNPVAPTTAVVAMNPRRRRMSRRSNPVRMIRRRRNPAMLGGFTFRSVIGAMQDALIQGGGAVAMDLLHGQINRFLPEMLKRTPGQVGLGDVVKASITVLVGTALRGPTRGLSMKAATGSLTVQAYDIVKNLLPSTMQLGYMTPGVITQGQANVGPNRGMVGRYTQPGATPLLNRYTQPGATALLNGNPARMREGVTIR
jgi:hypothetical protein